MVIIHPADKDTAMDTDVTAITAVMETTTEVMVNTGAYGHYGKMEKGSTDKFGHVIKD